MCLLVKSFIYQLAFFATARKEWWLGKLIAQKVFTQWLASCFNFLVKVLTVL